MTKDSMVRARIEADIKAEAEEIIRQCGLTPSQAINMFYRQVAIHQGLPFEVKIHAHAQPSKSHTDDQGD